MFQASSLFTSALNFTNQIFLSLSFQIWTFHPHSYIATPHHPPILSKSAHPTTTHRAHLGRQPPENTNHPQCTTPATLNLRHVRSIIWHQQHHHWRRQCIPFTPCQVPLSSIHPHLTKRKFLPHPHPHPIKCRIMHRILMSSICRLRHLFFHQHHRHGIHLGLIRRGLFFRQLHRRIIHTTVIDLLVFLIVWRFFLLRVYVLFFIYYIKNCCLVFGYYRVDCTCFETFHGGFILKISRQVDYFCGKW